MLRGLAAFVTAAVALVAACGASCAADRSAPPLPAAMQTRIRAAVRHDLAEFGGATPVPGVLLGIWTPDRGTMVEGIGLGRLSPPAPLSLADHVRIGSNTKTFVVTALLQLVDEKKLSLDDPVSAFRLPVRVRGGSKITVRELMLMRSGIFELYNLPILERMNVTATVPVDRTKLVQLACDEPRLFAPGAKWSYSNTNYLLLGMILEAVGHDTAEHQIEARILRPLHLTQTSFPVRDPYLPAPYAHGYQLANGAWADRSVLLPPSLTWTAGVMISTVGDMHRWVDAYVGGRTNGAATQRARLACEPTGDEGISFGLGIGCSAGWYGYTGGLPGYNTAAYYLPKSKITIIAFVTSQIDLPKPGVANAIFRDVAKIVTPGHVPYVATSRASR